MTNSMLEGITVLDATRWVAGGYATLMLANQGAEVVKIERPVSGDDIRHSGPPFISGESPYYWSVNYGKKSVEVDLKTEEGRELIYDLAEEADIFVENFRPGTVEKLGLAYDDLRSVNDELIYCSVSAFGQTGPWASRAGYDLLLQGLSGVMSVTGEQDGEPVKVGVAFADLVTSMWAAFAIVNALYRQERTGSGEYIDVSMLDSIVPWLTKQAGKVFAGEEPERMGTKDPLHAPYQSYEAGDGYLNIACGNQATWEALCHGIEREDLLEDERFASNPDRVEHMAELETELEKTLATRSVEEWVDVLADDYGVPVGPVLTVSDALEHEQVRYRELVKSLEHTTAGEQPVLEHPTKYREATHGFETHAPVLGEHTRDVLRGAGYDEATIADYLERGIVGETGRNRSE